MTKSRIFLWAMIAVIAGIGVESWVSIPIGVLFVGAMGAAVWIGVGVMAQKRGAWIPALFLLAFFCGAIRFAATDVRQYDLSSLEGESLMMRGVIDEEPNTAGARQRVAVRVASINGRDAPKYFRVLATTRQFPEYALGDEIIMRGVLDAPRQDGDFDEVSYLKRRGIAATLFYPKIERIGEQKGNWIVLRLAGLKRALEHNIDTILPEPHGALLKGLLLGERASLPPEIVEQFRATGTSHIVALSGYNITIIGSSLNRVLLWMTVPFLAAFWFASAAILLFIVMTGASASVVRAGIMGILLLIAQKEGRAYRITPALAFAAAVMVLHNPYILGFDAGFQLSFGATLGLVYLAPWVEQWIDSIARRARRDHTARAVSASEEKATHGPKKILIETLAAQIAVLPLLIFLFGRVSLISPITNVLVLLATPYAMGIGFVGVALAFVSSALGRIIGAIAWVVLEYQLRVIAWFAPVPFAGVALGNVALVGIIAVYCWIAWRIWRKSGKA